MNTRNKLRLLVPIIQGSFLVLLVSYGEPNDFRTLGIIAFLLLTVFYTIRFVDQYKQVEKEGTSKPFEDSTT